MTSSPKKYVSNFTSFTTNRGVEAREIEITNMRLDVTNGSSSTQFPGDSAGGSQTGAAAAGDCASLAASPPAVDESGSYIQVVVQKHRSKREPVTSVAQTSPRLPTASSPIVKNEPCEDRRSPKGICSKCGACGDAGWGGGVCEAAPGVLVWPQPMLLACSPQHRVYSWSGPHRALVAPAVPARAGEVDEKIKHVSRQKTAGNFQREKNTKRSLWKKMRDTTDEKYDTYHTGPDRVEVYYFERDGGEYLAAAAEGGAHGTRVERAVRRGARLARRTLDELLAVPLLLAAAPTALLLHVLRSALVMGRTLVGGAVQTASDHLLKPALALVFNAVVRPPLVCAAHVAGAVRDALRPLAGALGELAEPAVRVLGAARLVHVHVERGCGCGCAPRRALPAV